MMLATISQSDSVITTGLLMAAYLVAGMMFVLSIGGLSKQDTAKRGTLYGIIGMTVAVTATLLSGITNFAWLIPIMLAGVLIGGVLALRVQMTAMPELVAAFNGFGGIASALVAAVAVVQSDVDAFAPETSVSILLSIVIGSVTFTGSLVAFAKLQGTIPGRPIAFPGQHVVNGLHLLAHFVYTKLVSYNTYCI